MTGRHRALRQACNLPKVMIWATGAPIFLLDVADHLVRDPGEIDVELGIDTARD